MKKRYLCIICVTFFLAGCTAPKEPAEIPCTATPTIGESDNHGEGKITIPATDFGYYFNISSENVWDICPTMNNKLTYMLLTQEPLGDSLVLAQQLANSCTFKATECEDAWMTEFPFWLYQTYRGVDWNEVAIIAQAAESGDANAQKKLEEYETLYLADYESLTDADIPQFYAYWISNSLDTLGYIPGGTAKIRETLTFQIGTEEVTVDVGLLNVQRSGWDQCLNYDETTEDIYKGRLTDTTVSYWGDGTVTLAPITLREASPQTLQKLELYGMDGDILDIQVSYGKTTLHWDGASPLDIPKNTQITLVVTLQTQAHQTIGYCEDANLMLQRQMNDKTTRLWYFAGISQSWNMYELYAMMIDKLDISSYYAYTAQWKQPEPIPSVIVTEIPFNSYPIIDTEKYRLSVTGISWDEYSYCLHFSVENHSSEYMDFSLNHVYINNFYVSQVPEFDTLASGETKEYVGRISWETLSEFGINADSGEDIWAVEFTCVPWFENKLPEEKDAGYIRFYPLGEDKAQKNEVPGTIVLKTDTIRLYAGWLISNLNSGLNKSPEEIWGIPFIVENLSDDPCSFTITDCSVNGIAVGAIAASVIHADRFCYQTLAIPYQDNIDTPETLNLTFTLNNSETHTITIDLTTLPEE